MTRAIARIESTLTTTYLRRTIRTVQLYLGSFLSSHIARWRDGHADEVVLVDWGPNSVYVPPDGWFHQHMSTGKVPARHVAVYGGNLPLMSRSGGGEGGRGVYLPVREGGVLIDYEDEDPEVRRYFIEANRKEGVECTMPPVTYRIDPISLAF
jgi:hypothetical protein